MSLYIFLVGQMMKKDKMTCIVTQLNRTDGKKCTSKDKYLYQDQELKE